MAAPLLVATDMCNLKDVMKEVRNKTSDIEYISNIDPLNKEIISVNQDSLGAGGKKICYGNTGTCKEARFYSWLALYVYLKLFLCKKTYQIWSKYLEHSSKAVEL